MSAAKVHVCRYVHACVRLQVLRLGMDLGMDLGAPTLSRCSERPWERGWARTLNQIMVSYRFDSVGNTCCGTYSIVVFTYMHYCIMPCLLSRSLSLYIYMYTYIHA